MSQAFSEWRVIYEPRAVLKRRVLPRPDFTHAIAVKSQKQFVTNVYLYVA